MTQDLEEIPLENVVAASAIDTMENMPSTLFYRSFGVKRVTTQDIRNQNDSGEMLSIIPQGNKVGGSFGTFEGVFMRCVLNILSVVYFLRLGWVVGNCGLLMTYVLIIGCGIATTLTALSLSAIVTNGTVKGGGVYYCISRALGSDFGGTIGVMFSFATTFSSVLNTFGFIEVVRDLIGKDITTAGKWDIPIIGIGLVTLLVIVISISLAFEFYLQYILGILISVSILGVFFGFTVPGTPTWLFSNIKYNLYSHYQTGNSFWSIFAVFFPACTGIMAGANISGDLAKPEKSIPIGTLWAILFTTILYLITATILASVAPYQDLWTDFSILTKISVWKWLVYIGVLAASVSSASAGLVGGPKIFQALCKDDLLPNVFRFFAVGKESTDDPVRGFILAWVIDVICCFIFTDLNAVGKALTNFFLISYAIVCQSSLVGHLSHSPSWRPAWKYYHPTTAILGTAVCIIGMFLIDWTFALVTIGITVLIYMYFHWSERSNNNWGEFPQSLLFSDTIARMEKLSQFPEHVKNYRPQIEYIINTDQGSLERQIRNIVPFQQVASQARSLLIVSTFGENTSDKIEIGTFYRKWGKLEPETIARLISEAGGFGKIFPNLLALSITTGISDQKGLFELVGSAFDHNLAVAISRGFDSYDSSITHYWPIDVWWLSDDGGLVLLLGYLMTQHPDWSQCPLRCFTVASRTDTLTETQMKMTRLLRLFRIEAEIEVIVGIEDPPSTDTINIWNEYHIQIDDQATMKKINTFLRLREMIKEQSAHSSVIICSLPIPRVQQDPSVWVGLLDAVSQAMPPFIWAHGNNENVVTFMT